MNKSQFTIFTLAQDISVTPKEISASFDGLNSKITFLLRFTFRQPDPEMYIEINSLESMLSIGNAELSKTTTITGFTIDKKRSNEEKSDSQVFSFDLSERAINFIEKNRKGDLQLKLNLRFALNFHTTYHLINDGARVPINSARTVQIERADIYIDIPQSQWVKEILPALNYQSFHLIELPLDHKTLKEAYEKVRLEFEKANSYFKNHQYEDCVGACRKTMDKLKENLTNYKEKAGSEANYEWLRKINQHTYTWIDAMNKANSAITSKPHHTGDHEFTRAEAESIYLVTLGLMHFIGSIK